jgi:hypothetical protein
LTTLAEVKEQNLPLALSLGMGVDSVAVIVGLKQRGITPDMILFADVGDEKPETYLYIPKISAWLKKNDFPPVTIVQYRAKRFKHGEYRTLFGNCWQNRTLPSLAFGRKACSNKWKIAPMDKKVEAVYKSQMSSGGKIARAIGYDAGPKDSRRGGKVTECARYTYVYPLREWGWDRERCKAEIAAEGLDVPVKSACFFCPSVQKCELTDLSERHPRLAALSVAMEDRAQPNLQKIEGLWRTGCKGIRKPENKKPGSWRTYLEQEDLIDEDLIREVTQDVEMAVLDKAAVTFSGPKEDRTFFPPQAV